jgi:hypothetical protein
LLGLMVAPLVLLGTAGCIGGPSTPPIKPVQVITGPSARSADPAQVKAASDAALAAYKGYVKAYVAAAASGDWASKTIDKYAADPARTEAHRTLRDETDKHIVSRGEPVSTPVVTVVNLDGASAAVSIADCIDATHWRKFDQQKQVYLTVSPVRHAVVALVIDYPVFGWLVQQVSDSVTKC